MLLHPFDADLQLRFFAVLDAKNDTGHGVQNLIRCNTLRTRNLSNAVRHSRHPSTLPLPVAFLWYSFSSFSPEFTGEISFAVIQAYVSSCESLRVSPDPSACPHPADAACTAVRLGSVHHMLQIVVVLYTPGRVHLLCISLSPSQRTSPLLSPSLTLDLELLVNNLIVYYISLNRCRPM